MTPCCPHPAPVHDPVGRCAVLHCACERLDSVMIRCSCPYNDCYVLVTTKGETCAPCLAVCVPAKELDRRQR